jgi:transposase
MSEKYVVMLTGEELAAIDTLLRKGKGAARRLKRANILRLADDGYNDEEIKELTRASVATIERVRAKFVRGGLTWALSEEPRTGAPRKLDGKQEAFLIALACTTPPSGHECWTMQLLADRLLKWQVIEREISEATVRRVLKKTNSSPGFMSNGVFPKLAPNLSGAWKMC